MTDAERLRAVITRSGLTISAWARTVAIKEPSTVFRWLAGRPIPRNVRRELIDPYAPPRALPFQETDG